MVQNIPEYYNIVLVYRLYHNIPEYTIVLNIGFSDFSNMVLFFFVGHTF